MRSTTVKRRGRSFGSEGQTLWLGRPIFPETIQTVRSRIAPSGRSSVLTARSLNGAALQEAPPPERNSNFPRRSTAAWHLVSHPLGEWLHAGLLELTSLFCASCAFLRPLSFRLSGQTPLDGKRFFGDRFAPKKITDDRSSSRLI